MDSPLTGIKFGTRHVVRLSSFAYWPFKKRLGHAHRADQHPEGLQRCLRPAHETIEVRGRESTPEAIPIRAIGGGVEFKAPVRCGEIESSDAGLPAGAFNNASVSTPLVPYLFFFDLPDKRHQSIPHLPGILRISRQILVQESFLIQKPP